MYRNFFSLLIILSSFLVSASTNLYAQNTVPTDTLFNPKANAVKDIEQAIALAKKQNKFVFIDGGGNWCVWCKEFERVSKSTPAIDSIFKNNFVVYHLNYSKENKNSAVFAKLQYPQRFGFPVFIILDTNGNRIHTQNTAYLEDGKKSYDVEKVVDFLLGWSPAALNPNLYK